MQDMGVPNVQNPILGEIYVARNECQMKVWHPEEEPAEVESNRRRIFEWCPGTELNRRHEDFQSSALPTELPGPEEGREERGKYHAEAGL